MKSIYNKKKILQADDKIAKERQSKQVYVDQRLIVRYK